MFSSFWIVFYVSRLRFFPLRFVYNFLLCYPRKFHSNLFVEVANDIWEKWITMLWWRRRVKWMNLGISPAHVFFPSIWRDIEAEFKINFLSVMPFYFLHRYIFFSSFFFLIKQKEKHFSPVDFTFSFLFALLFTKH